MNSIQTNFPAATVPQACTLWITSLDTRRYRTPLCLSCTPHRNRNTIKTSHGSLPLIRQISRTPVGARVVGLPSDVDECVKLYRERDSNPQCFRRKLERLLSLSNSSTAARMSLRTQPGVAPDGPSRFSENPQTVRLLAPSYTHRLYSGSARAI